jgi:hypothetical protein
MDALRRSRNVFRLAGFAGRSDLEKRAADRQTSRAPLPRIPSLREGARYGRRKRALRFRDFDGEVAKIPQFAAKWGRGDFGDGLS